jgi:hypothetical protein
MPKLSHRFEIVDKTEGATTLEFFDADDQPISTTENACVLLRNDWLFVQSKESRPTQDGRGIVMLAPYLPGDTFSILY